MVFGTEHIELLILDGIQRIFGCGFMDFLMPLVTALGNVGIIWIVICIGMLISRKYRKNGIKLALALVLVLIIGNIVLKPLVARPRPFTFNQAELLIAAPGDYSFPSGHTMASFVSAFVIYDRDRRMGIAAIALAILIAFSRMYLYVHFPTDVLAGIIVAAVVFAAVRRINTERWFYEK